MSKTQANLTTAYMWAAFAPLLGIIGAHRYYLSRPLSATLMSAPLLVAVFMIISSYYTAVNAFITTAIRYSDGSGHFGDILDIPSLTETFSPLSLLLITISFLWWIIDLIRMPYIVKHANQ